MKNTLRLIILLSALSMVSSIMRASQFNDESLNYKVLFKWGLVQKQAGTAKLTLTSDGSYYTAKLYARSDNWADHFYKLRDTLITRMDIVDNLPVHYERIAHEKDSYAHDIIVIDKRNENVKGQIKRIRQGKNSALTEDDLEVEAKGATVDMLSAFYYIRCIDFTKKLPGFEKKINIFSAKKRETLTIRYIGREDIDIDGKRHRSFKVTFNFTTDGKNKSSDDIETWIWDNQSRIPLKMDGKLKVGRIRCIYTGSN